MVVDVVHLLELREVGEQTRECLLAERQVVELVLEDDARVVESVLNDEVASCHLFFGERYLCEVILTLVRIVLFLSRK